MSRFEAVCFDLFNTLISVGRVPESVGRFTADILGIERERWNEACFGPHHEICRPTEHGQIIRRLAHSIEPGLPEQLIQQATVARQRRFDHALMHVEKDVIKTLTCLRQHGYKLALISNASTGEVAAWQHSPLAGCFDQAIFSCECGLQKPQVEIYQHAVSSLGCRAHMTLFVGDGGSREFVGARQAGLQTILSRQYLSPSRYTKVRAEQGASIGSEIASLKELLAFA